MGYGVESKDDHLGGVCAGLVAVMVQDKRVEAGARRGNEDSVDALAGRLEAARSGRTARGNESRAVGVESCRAQGWIRRSLLKPPWMPATNSNTVGTVSGQQKRTGGRTEDARDYRGTADAFGSDPT